MSAAAPPPFFTRYGFTRTGNPEAPLELAPYPAVCAHGALRVTVIASAIDLVGGFTTREVAGSDATFTSDLSLRIVRPGIPARLVAHAEPLRVGRRLVTTGVRLEADAETYAYGETSFVRIARETGAAPDVRTLATPEAISFHPLERPLDEEVGIETVDAAAGSIRLALRPALLNPEGALQGALAALIVECAALALADHERGRPQLVTELDLRYLAAASAGPVVARAACLGPPATGMIRVETRDQGRDDRLTTSALVRVADAPEPESGVS
ncbi:MAG: hotdog domain-containing protein [Myxococcota bacterium]